MLLSFSSQSVSEPGFGLSASVQCLFSLGLPFCLQFPRALLVRVFSFGLAASFQSVLPPHRSRCVGCLGSLDTAF